MDELPLRDIKPLMEVPDNSIYFFSGIVIVGILILGLIIYAIIKMVKKRGEINLRKMYLQRLKEVDLSDAKGAAYEITYCLHSLEIEPKNIEMAHNLIERLEKYKYRKEVTPLDEDVKSYYHLMVEVLSE